MKIIDDLRKYMFINENIIVEEQKKEKKEMVNNKKKEVNDNIFFPNGKDKLFWCFYITLYSIDMYEQNINNLFKIEKNFKISCAEKLRDNKDIVKVNKLKRSQIEDQLVNSQCIDIQTLVILCILNNVSIVYVCKHVYYDINSGCEQKGYIIKTDNNLGLYKSVYDEENLKKTHMLIENPAKPIKSFSSYSSKDLQEICKKLDIPIQKKKEMYQCICEKIE
tara:strand:- start:21868 stop:22530 length:663 start_codon:yes stop_codon:yes gene_type:complete